MEYDFKEKKQTRDGSWSVSKFLKAYYNINIFNIYAPLHIHDTKVQSQKNMLFPHEAYILNISISK